MGNGIRLNLGCGQRYWEGWVNIDHPEGKYRKKQPDVLCDIRKLPFDDEYADHASAIHVIEHFYVWEAEDVLREWHRVLKTGGTIAIECPCLDKIVGHFVRALETGQMEIRDTLWGLYGDPGHKDPYMTHHWCYSVNDMKTMLEKVGFKDVKYMEPVFHKQHRDMRIEGTK